MEFVFAKIYVKFYLVQINSSKSYYDYLVQNKEVNDLDLAFDDNEDINPENLIFNENTNDKEVNVLFKKFFYFKNKIFSKVEVLGLVVETLYVGNNIKNERFFITLDDTTSKIQCICWRNKNPNIFDKIKSTVVVGDQIRLFGYIDNYKGFEILIDNFGKFFKFRTFEVIRRRVTFS